MANDHLDFDSNNPLKLVEDAKAMSESAMRQRLNQFDRNYKLYHGFIDSTSVDPGMPNVTWPKIRSIVETLLPRYIRASYGVRPFLPFKATRREFKSIVEAQELLLDDYLYRGGFFNKIIQGLKISIMHGTSFLEAVPYLIPVMEKRILMDEFGQVVPDANGMPQTKEFPAERFRLKMRVYAPWEVYPDPWAIGLEERGDCRYVILIDLVSKRQIVEMTEQGAYPGLDIDRLMTGGQSSEKSEHWGLRTLTDMGLSLPDNDDDMGVLFRYRTPDRNIDIWNGQTVLSDSDNPFEHKQINLSRLIHGQDPHTQNAFYGMGEVKPNEVLASLLNDNWTQTMFHHQIINQPAIFYRKDSISPDSIVMTPGNRIPVSSTNNRPLTDSIYMSAGQTLPRDHYMIPQAIERAIDFNSGVMDIQRGEQAATETTATESAMRKEAGEARFELMIRQHEVFQADFGHKCLSHISQFTRFEDRVEVLGQQMAAQMLVSSPADLPGGYNFMFKGADMVTNKLIRQRNLQEVMSLLLQIPNVQPGGLAVYTMRQFDFPEADIRELVIPDEQQQQIEQQQQAQGEQAETRTQGRDQQHKTDIQHLKGRQQMERGLAQTQRKFKEHNTTQNAQDASRELVRR